MGVGIRRIGIKSILRIFWICLPEKVFYFPSCIYSCLLVQLEKNKCSKEK